MAIQFIGLYWYRHETDDDRTMRANWQMSAGFQTVQGAIDEADKLSKSGYTVQRVDVSETCAHCDGSGRLSKAPKGTRKAKIATLPAWMLQWSDCPKCAGDGSVKRETIFTT